MRMPTLTLETLGQAGTQEILLLCRVCLIPSKSLLAEQDESHRPPLGLGHLHRKTFSLLWSPVGMNKQHGL